MSFRCDALNVMLSGPGDVDAQIKVVEDVIYAWNRERAKSSSVVLLPRHWSTDAVSSFSLGAGGQAEINQQLVKEADIVFALFHARLGTATQNAVSGTAEEVEQAIEGGLPVHVFFSTAPVPHTVDVEQFTALKTFKESLSGRGLFSEFTTDDDLRGLVRRSLEADVTAFNAAADTSATVAASKGAVKLSAHYDYREVTETDSRGRVRTRKTRERIVIRNDGDAPAYNVTMNLEPIGEGSSPMVFPAEGDVVHFETIAPHGEVSVPVALTFGVAQVQRAVFTWSEEGEQKEFSHTLTW